MQNQTGTAQTRPLGAPPSHTLGGLALSYAPVIDRRYTVRATRLTLHTLQSEQPPDLDALLAAIRQAWPARQGHGVILNATSFLLVRGLLTSRLAANIGVEIPETLAMRPDQAHAIQRLHEAGTTLLVHDYGSLALPPELQPCFSYVVNGQLDSTSTPRTRRPELQWSPKVIRIDVSTLPDMQTRFDQGAVAVTGWPLATPVQAARFHRLRARGSMDVVLKAIRLLNQEQPPAQIAHAIAGDPSLVYRLLRYVNSVRFSLPIPVTSIADAITFLGHHKLKRWLVLMLTSVAQDTPLRPTAFAAVRRGVMLERMAQLRGTPEVAGDLFICGILSLIDRMLGLPMAQLLDAIRASDATAQALTHGRGPHAPYLDMVRTLETGLTYPIYEAAEKLALSMGSVNQALFGSMPVAFDMEQP